MIQKLAPKGIRGKIPTTGTRLEEALLLCCARTYMDTASAERLKNLLREDIDWAHLLLTASSHGAIALLYQSLNNTCPEAVPKPVLSQLRNFFHINAKRNFFQTGKLLELLHLFATHEIPAIPFKGPVLAAAAYGNLSLRQFGDLDILVRQQDFLRTKNLLISQGYQLQRGWSWESHFVHTQSRVNVDLHQGITSRCFPDPIQFEHLWERLEPLSLAGTIVSNLLPEDMILLLCVQCSKDCCDQNLRVAQLCDVAELLRVHPQMDWQRFIEHACRLGCERMLLLDLYLVSELLGATLPEEVLSRLQANPVVKSLAELVRARLFRKAEEPLRGLEEKTFWSSWFYHQRLHLRLTQRLHDRVTYCLYRVGLVLLSKIIPNNYDRAFLPLPRFLYCLYYLLRPIRLARKYAPVLLERFSRT